MAIRFEDIKPKAELTKAEVKSAKVQDGERAMAEHHAKAAAVDANTERLKALRLARDAELAEAAAIAEAAKPAPKKRAKAKAKA